MKAVRLENFGTKTPPGKSAEEWRRKKKNLTNTAGARSGGKRGDRRKGHGAAGTPPERRPTYSETMQGYYGDRYADALAENKTAADTAAETAERDAQDALERIRGGYKSTRPSALPRVYGEQAHACRSVSPHRASPAA